MVRKRAVGSNQYKARAGFELETDASNLMVQVSAGRPTVVSRDDERQKQLAQAKNPSTSSRQLDKLARSPYVPVLKAVAANPKTSARALGRLTVRSCVMFHKRNMEPVMKNALTNPSADRLIMQGARGLIDTELSYSSTMPDDIRRAAEPFHLDETWWDSLPPPPDAPYTSGDQQNLVQIIQGTGLGEVAVSGGWDDYGSHTSAVVVCTDGWFVMADEGQAYSTGYVDLRRNVDQQLAHEFVKVAQSGFGDMDGFELPILCYHAASTNASR